MSLLLMALASAALGYAVFATTRQWAVSWETARQRFRLRSLLESDGSISPRRPLQDLLDRSARMAALALSSRYLNPYRDHLATLLRRADRPERLKPEHLLAYQFWAAFGGAGLFLFASGDGLLALLAFAGGAAYPWLWVKERAAHREGLLLAQLPHALEGFSLCVEAGLTLEQSIEHYVQQGRPHPLKDEFGKLLRQTRAGSSRRDALLGLRDRIQLTEVSLFVTSVIHAERAGTGVSSVLKRLAATLRDQQVQRAEKTVQELPVKLLLPLLFCILPVTFLVLFGPVVLQLLR